MLYAGKQPSGVTLGRLLLRGPSRSEVLLTGTTHARVPRLLVRKKTGTVGTTTMSVSYAVSRDISSGTAPRSQQCKAGKCVHGQSHGQTPVQQQQPTNGPAQHTRSKKTGMAPASATPRASGCQTAYKAVVTKSEPAAPEASSQDNDHYVYIRLPRENMAPVDNEPTTTLQHQVPQNARPQNAAPVLHSAPLQLPAPASQQSCGDSNVTTSYARVSVLHPGVSGGTSVDTVETEPHLDALTQHVAWRLAVPGASAAAEVKAWMDFGSRITQLYRRSW